MRRAVGYMCRLLERTKHIDLECGALYHAAHGLVLYRAKVYGPRDSLAGAGQRGRRSPPPKRVASPRRWHLVDHPR